MEAEVFPIYLICASAVWLGMLILGMKILWRRVSALILYIIALLFTAGAQGFHLYLIAHWAAAWLDPSVIVGMTGVMWAFSMLFFLLTLSAVKHPFRLRAQDANAGNSSFTETEE